MSSSALLAPMVSAIIPTFNRAHVLARAIDSVLAQSYPSIEIIVVDDGSEDHTEEVLKAYEQRKNVHLLKTENRGVSHARNLAARSAKGQWLAFLDSDDEWLPEKIEMQMTFSVVHPHISLIHGEEIWVRNGRRVNPKKKHKKYGGHIFENCLSLCLISPSASMIKKSLYDQFGGFDESFVVCEDYRLWLHITLHHEVGFIEAPIIIKYGGHSDQLSTRYVAMDYWRVKTLGELLNVLASANDIRYKKVAAEMVKKASVLLSGYVKHENLSHFSEIQQAFELAKRWV